MKIHIVKEGDNLYSLSQRYSVELEKIVAANPHILDPMRVEPGQKVKVPTGPVTPKVEALAEKPKVEAQAEKPMVEAQAEKPKVEAAAEKPKVEAAGEKKPKTDFEAETYSPLSQPAAEAPELISTPAPAPAPTPAPAPATEPESNIQDVIEEKKPAVSAAAEAPKEMPAPTQVQAAGAPTVNFVPMPSLFPLAQEMMPESNVPSQAATLPAFDQPVSNQALFGGLPLPSLPSAPYLPPMMPQEQTMPMVQSMPMMPQEHMMPTNPMLPLSQMMAPIMPMPSENPFHLEQQAVAEQHPAAFKSNMQQSAYSPLHVNLPGFEEEAVHPFAQFPTQAVEAGAYMHPFGAFPEVPLAAPFGQPFPPFPLGMGPADQGFFPGQAIAPFGVLPTAPLMPAAGGFPAYPAAHPGTMTYPVYGMPLHDCGCGGIRTRPPLPYALPLSDQGAQETAEIRGFPAEIQPEAAKADDSVSDDEAKKAKSPKSKKEASVPSRRETVRKFLSTRKPKSKPARQENKPWIYS